MILDPGFGSRSRRFCSIIPALLVLLFATAAPLQSQESAVSKEKRAQIETAVSNFLTSTHVPGVSVAVVENGQYEWGAGFGYADLENNAPASEHTLFRRASTSKPLTATAPMQLGEAAQRHPDAPEKKYRLSFPKKPWPITPREDRGPRGGIRHYKSGSQDDPEVGN